MSLEKPEDLSNQNWKALETYLSEVQASSKQYITQASIVRNTPLSRSAALAVLTYLCNEEVLQAKVKVRCPECDQHEGTYSRQSAVPDESVQCFCGNEFQSSRQASWEVVYSISEEANPDFFRTISERLRIYTDFEVDLQPSYFTREYQRLRDLEGISNANQRGQLFDYLIGLLFAQIDGVSVAVKKRIPKGEIDVFVDCIEGPQWLQRIVGNAALVENKWESNPVGQSEIQNFYTKAKDISERTPSNLGYFISMSGFTEDAIKELEGCTNPNIIYYTTDEVEDMIERSNPSEILRNSII